MLFNSPQFLFIFLPAVLVCFYVSARFSAGLMKASLFASSLVFYAYWNVAFLPLLLGSVIANYLIGTRLSANRSRALLTAGISLNLLLLGYFKYAYFIAGNLAPLFGSTLSLPDIVLPIGISFITFEQIAFLVDGYRGRVKNRAFIDYGLFVTFFPQLIAGPIFHHRDICPQFARFHRFYSPTGEQFAHGLFLLFVGLFKKVVIADWLANYANPVFDNPSAAGFFDAWVGSLAYTFQLYFDFSAYSEMAMGLALFFGITIPKNFDSPYKSRSIQEFWRRWHMTLGAFLREYLFHPLGGSHHGLSRTVSALMITMLLGGLWHGAGWTFVLWGALHGFFLVVNALWRRSSYQLPPLVSLALTFCCVHFAWVLFRASSFDDALTLWSSMVGMNGITLPTGLQAVFGDLLTVDTYLKSPFFHGLEPLLLLVVLFAVLRLPNVHELRHRLEPTPKWAFATIASAACAIVLLGQPSDFIYFQF